MSEDEVARAVLDIVASLAPVKGSEITPDSRLVEDLGYHSLALLELSVALEDTFNLPPLDETAVREIDSVGDISSLVSQTLASV